MYGTDLVIIIIDAINIVITIDSIDNNHDDAIILVPVVIAVETDRVIITIDAIHIINHDDTLGTCNNVTSATASQLGTTIRIFDVFISLWVYYYKYGYEFEYTYCRY